MFLSQFYFDLPKKLQKITAVKYFCLNKQKKKRKKIENRKIRNINRHAAGFDMNYDEFKKFCRKPWEEEYIFLCIDRSKMRDQ